MTAAYKAAQKAGSTPVQLAGAGTVKTVEISGESVAKALGGQNGEGGASIRVGNLGFRRRSDANAEASSRTNAITFFGPGLSEADSGQMRTTIHEGIHLTPEAAPWFETTND